MISGRGLPSHRVGIELLKIVFEALDGPLLRYAEEVSNPLRILQDITGMHQYFVPPFGGAKQAICPVLHPGVERVF